jgi:hypothetical protein
MTKMMLLLLMMVPDGDNNADNDDTDNNNDDNDPDDDNDYDDNDGDNSNNYDDNDEKPNTSAGTATAGNEELALMILTQKFQEPCPTLDLAKECTNQEDAVAQVFSDGLLSFLESASSPL